MCGSDATPAVGLLNISAMAVARRPARCVSLQPLPKPLEGKQAALAQLVEQLIRNEQVVGSSPISGSD